MSSIAKVRVFPGRDEQWYYEPQGANGETLSKALIRQLTGGLVIPKGGR